ncbi:MAG: hypothetical protein IPH51_16990 [Rubrivivax sp.]|nr:hypothetical protein [Rubrivivax sp.]
MRSTRAEQLLRQALAAGLPSGRDRASAHKLLAFIQCTSDRVAGCEADSWRHARPTPALCSTGPRRVIRCGAGLSARSAVALAMGPGQQRRP